MSRSALIGGLLGLLTLAPVSRADAPAEAPLRVPRAGSAIRVDGVLDEPAWASALSLSLTYETYPGDNLPAPVRTDCLVLHDERNLYLGFRAFDPDPGAIRTYLADRDNLSGDEDQIQFVLDTFNDQRRAYVFAAGPLGVQWDAIASEVGGAGLSYDSSWDAVWRVQGRIDRDGYTLEIAVPFASLRFPRGGGEQTWGLHVTRYQPRSVQRQLSLRPIDRSNNCFLCQEGQLTGFEGVRTGLNLELDPTLTATRSDEREPFPDGPMRQGALGGDLGITTRFTPVPDLTLSAAVNPDFSQVEADTAQLKINTRFALYYPERRPLFLEGADFFQTRLNTIYTRTVADPSWGAKLVGKGGPNALGVVVAQDRITNLILPANQESRSTSLDQEATSSIVRYRRDVGASSTLGALLTDREGSGYSNRVLGVDGMFRLSERDTLNAQALVSRTEYPAAVAAAFDQPDGLFRGSALNFGYQHQSKDWNWGVSGSDLGRNLRVDTGFIPRVDTRSAGASVERVVWGDPQGALIRTSFGASLYRNEDHDGLLTDELKSVFFRWDGPRQSGLSVDLNRTSEFFAGTTYDLADGSVSFSVSPRGDLSFDLSGDFGDEVDYDNCRPGRVVRLDPGVSFKAGRHVRVSLDDTYETLHVEGGRLFRASLAQTRIAWQLSVRAMARAIVQYTDIRRDPDLYLTVPCQDLVQAGPPPPVIPPPEKIERTLFTQLLYSYKVNPQTALYIGYSEDRPGDTTTPLTQSDRTFFFKIGYAFLP
jgi:uncharacterized protein DUF5916